MVYTDHIILLDRTQQTRTVSTDIPNGNMTPWRKRLELVNTGEDGVDNSGTIKLRIDELKTFLKTGPLLMQEDAKTKYLIEVHISQVQSGSTVRGKYFMFQIGTPSITVDSRQGAIMTIQLQEIQRRTQEVVTGRELRFLSPKEALDERMLDFYNYEKTFNSPTGNHPVEISGSATASRNKLPNAPKLEYVPQSPISVKKSVDQLFGNLSEAQATGGVFTDFYYDFDPDTTIGSGYGGTSGKPLLTYIIADEIGRVDTGVVVNPLSTEPIDAEESQQANTNFFNYRNHVIARGAPSGGSLPTEHSKYSSDWLHAKLRPEFDSSNSVDDRDGNSFKYLKGMTVKRTFTIPSMTSTDEQTAMPPTRRRTIKTKNVIRFFTANKNITSANRPELAVNSNDDWIEDFMIIPPFDKTGHYVAGDVIYYLSGSSYIFYQATEDIFDWSVNRFRENWVSGSTWSFPANTENDSNYTTKHLKTDGFLKNPNESNSGWRSLNTVGTPHNCNSHTTSVASTWVGYKGFSPWTADVFDWEKNMAGLKSNVLPRSPTGGKYNKTSGTGTPNRYVGLMPDWNMTKDVYEKQDDTDEFEQITMKWVSGIVDEPPSDGKQIYHGQRFMVSKSSSVNASDWTISGRTIIDGDGNTISTADLKNRLVQYIYDPQKRSRYGGTRWIASKAPEDGDIFNNLDDGRVYQWDATRSPAGWVVSWKIAKEASPDTSQAYDDNITRDVSPSAPFHIVKDVYKTQGFEGTPNSAVAVRYAWMAPDLQKQNPSVDGSPVRLNPDYYPNGAIDVTKAAYLCRKNSRGLWMWFWNPFPRREHGDNGTVNIGDKYGGNGETPIPKSGYTTLNIYNNATDRHQSTQGWNNGLASEDMGKISSLTFKVKVSITSQPVDNVNDDYFWGI